MRKRFLANNYVNNADLLKSLVEYRKRVRRWKRLGCREEKPRVPDYIGRCIWMMCERMGTRWNWVSYSFRDEMVGDAILNLCEAVEKFNPAKSNNPFGYFSMIAWRAFLRRLESENNHTYIRLKNLENLHILDEHAELIGVEDTIQPKRNIRTEFTDEFMNKFENRQNLKKKPKVMKKKSK